MVSTRCESSSCSTVLCTSAHCIGTVAGAQGCVVWCVLPGGLLRAAHFLCRVVTSMCMFWGEGRGVERGVVLRSQSCNINFWRWPKLPRCCSLNSGTWELYSSDTGQTTNNTTPEQHHPTLQQTKNPLATIKQVGIAIVDQSCLKKQVNIFRGPFLCSCSSSLGSAAVASCLYTFSSFFDTVQQCSHSTAAVTPLRT